MARVWLRDGICAKGMRKRSLAERSEGPLRGLKNQPQPRQHYQRCDRHCETPEPRSRAGPLPAERPPMCAAIQKKGSLTCRIAIDPAPTARRRQGVVRRAVEAERRQDRFDPCPRPVSTAESELPLQCLGDRRGKEGPRAVPKRGPRFGSSTPLGPQLSHAGAGRARGPVHRPRRPPAARAPSPCRPALPAASGVTTGERAQSRSLPVAATG